MNLNYNSLFTGRSSANKKEILDVGVPTSSFSKTFRLLMISLLMICTGFSFAQTTVTIPAANTNSGSVRQPLASWFGYERAAMIYTPAQIGSTGTITNVRFYLNSVSSPGASTDVRVYMKERTTTFTATSTYATETTGATLVYGPVTLSPSTFVANTWVDLPLSTTFNYTGGSNNLEVIVETNATGGGSGESSTGKQFRYNTQASNQFYQNWAADTSPPTGTGTRSANRPNAQLVFAASLTPPNCAASLVPAVSATGVARNATLSWGSGGGGPTSYDVYFGSSAGAPFVGNQVGTTYSPGLLSANTTYYWKIVPKNANGDATGCVEQSFTTGTGFDYCAPTYSNGSGTGDGITNVSLGSLNNTSGNSASPYYTFFNAVAIPTIAQSTTAGVSITLGSDTNQFSAVWIDFDQNGTFDASEGFLASGNAGASGTSVINVTVPSGAALGNTRMRIRGGDDSALTTVQACGASNSTWGETEDYIVEIIAAPICLPASGLSVSAITSNSASLSWVAPSPAPSNGYEWAVTTSSTPPSSGTPTAGTTASASGLSMSTLHYLHVRSSCGIDGFSPWATTSFTTGLGCGSTFYDNGGAGGNYTNNLNTTTTIFPTNVGDGVIATFTAFGTESCCDSLSIYDGPDATYPLIGTYAGTTSPGVVTSTNSASGALTFVFTSDTSLVDIGWEANITCFTFPTDTPDYVNLQFPASATILAGGSATVYAQVYEAGLTDTEPGFSGQAAGIESWIGISPIGSNSNPNTWTTWIPATHNAGHVSNNDEYQASIGSALVPGTYYYASRFRLNGGPFVYGGNPFNAWDGTTSVSGVLTVNPNPTQCATNVAPVDAATNVTIGTVALSWAAPTSGPAPTSYDVYYGTTSGALTLVTNTTSLTYNASAPAYSTPYYWRIVPKSTVGGDATACSEWSFTTQPNPFAPYCSTITYSIDVEPITSVDFAGITNTSSNTVDGSPALENFISISGNVTTENSYTMTLKGNTAGNFTTNFRVFIDWNQDGDFADLGETFNAGSVTNSNGLDATSAVSTIAVPSSALAGSTRMRIKKLYSVDSGSVDNPCAGGEYGQTEDYTLNVTLCTPLNWYADNDGDTYGDPTTLVSACTSPGANYVLVSGDCNDANAAVNPNATEVCYDGIDNNCDGTIDEGCTPIISVVQTAQCGSTLSSINQQIFANLVAGAQGYRFRVTDMSNMQVQTIDR
ncbi:MAG: hypothetical protein J0L86_00005, partial [Flavobacteriales bacterium]|nr:hypothetical protein [Flavobacteriales bacterium]